MGLCGAVQVGSVLLPYSDINTCQRAETVAVEAKWPGANRPHNLYRWLAVRTVGASCNPKSIDLPPGYSAVLNEAISRDVPQATSMSPWFSWPESLIVMFSTES